MAALVWLALPLVATIGFQEGGRDVNPPVQVRVLRDVRAEIKSKGAAHELVALELRGPTPPIIGYLMRAGRIRFDIVDDQGRRLRQVFYEDVVAFLTSTPIDAWPLPDRRWRGSSVLGWAVMPT